MSDKKYLSVFMDRLLPDYIRTEYAKFESFIRTYFEYLEQNGKVLQLIFDMLHYIDIDRLELDDPNSNGDDLVIEEHVKTFLSSFPLYRISDIDIKKLIKNSKDFYSAKGTERSYDFIFRLMNHFGKFSFYYPQDYIANLDESSTTLSGNSFLHDNFYRAYFTYEIQSDEFGYSELHDIISTMIHPIGCKAFFLRLIYSDTAQDPYNYMTGEEHTVFLLETEATEWQEYGEIQDIFNGATSWTFQELAAMSVYILSYLNIEDWTMTFDQLENSTGMTDKFLLTLGSTRTIL